MTSNILDSWYEGYGYDMDDQNLYFSAEAYNASLSENGNMSTSGMETLSHGGPVGHDSQLETEKARTYNEIHTFLSEEGASYTDLRGMKCACGE